MLTVCRRACRVALTSHAKRVRDGVEAGGGAVGARAGRLVLGVEDGVLGRLAAARRARGVRGTEKRHSACAIFSGVVMPLSLSLGIIYSKPKPVSQLSMYRIV